MLPLLISVIPFGLILGALSTDKGLSPLESTLMSALVFAGSAQFVAAGLWQHPIPILVIVASTALINSRHPRADRPVQRVTSSSVNRFSL